MKFETAKKKFVIKKSRAKFVNNSGSFANCTEKKNDKSSGVKKIPTRLTIEKIKRRLAKKTPKSVYPAFTSFSRSCKKSGVTKPNKADEINITIMTSEIKNAAEQVSVITFAPKYRANSKSLNIPKIYESNVPTERMSAGEKSL